ncbi:asparagine synthase (glutamine-hydrolyzing) [candidate division KSB3 bacterium]|uniref:asparagine synthase (glutamine-hydrolyzing) n=1 Tax=candidate division KSB3 bacterium TaxID=2044937 RepID=A0A2G6E3F9_9BACT|nr:MAG: asparagine synthase (glutamine-hydrolyzing) [candidate division KSB3 bacterium]PIE28909.1 MAG: asparagine synthase (glutamine-hydrolyzing) [candidate division KSB3 bacterium]
MCGICGIVQSHDTFSVRRETLQRMNDVISHRGPDDEGFYIDQKVGLAMRRLSIIDLAGGHQPIHNKDKTLHIVFNGEIYNFQELRHKLEKSGYRFVTNSDTETILHGYKEYGIEVLRHLRGMFGFAIWDSREDTLFLARDRPGIKPLHYYQDNEKFLFGSEIKSILQCENVPREVNLDALDRFLTFEYVFSPETIFQHIHKLPPGHFLLLKNGEIRIEQYWDNLPKLGQEHSEDDYAAHLAEVLEEATRLRMISDVPLGALLSGGIDSSTIVAYMAKHSARPVKTFSIGFEEQSYNELDYARTVSEHFKTEHHEFIIKPDAVDLVDRLVRNLDEPFGDFSIFPTYLVSKMAREHVTVVLSGDGGDELFAGYDTYIADRVARSCQKLPSILRKRAIPAFVNSIPPSPKKKGFANRAKRFVEGTMLSPDFMHTRWMTFLQDQEKRQLYTGALLDSFENGNSHKYILEYFQRSSSAETPLAQQGYVDIKTYMTDDILVKVDRMSMATSLETRVPFLDHHVMEYAATIPTRLKLKGLTTKYILKKAVNGLLPDKILTRGKEGFSIPIKNWLGHELRPLLLETLSEKRIAQRGYFQPAYVRQLVQEHLDGKENHSHRLWALMMFEIWHQHYID